MEERAPFFVGTLRKGKLSFDTPDAYRAWVVAQERRVALGLSGDRFVLTIEEQWSAEAREFYFKIVKWLSDLTGNTRLEMHGILKTRFNDGLSITGLSRDEFNDYTDEVIVFAAEQGLAVPEPNRGHRVDGDGLERPR